MSLVTCWPPSGDAVAMDHRAAEEDGEGGGAAAHVDDGAAEIHLILDQRREAGGVGRRAQRRDVEMAARRAGGDVAQGLTESPVTRWMSASSCLAEHAARIASRPPARRCGSRREWCASVLARRRWRRHFASAWSCPCASTRRTSVSVTSCPRISTPISKRCDWVCRPATPTTMSRKREAAHHRRRHVFRRVHRLADGRSPPRRDRRSCRCARRPTPGARRPAPRTRPARRSGGR